MTTLPNEYRWSFRLATDLDKCLEVLADLSSCGVKDETIKIVPIDETCYQIFFRLPKS